MDANISKNLEYLAGFVSGVFMVLSQFSYLKSTALKRIYPSLFSWIGWASLSGISLFSIIQEKGWHWNLVSQLFSTICSISVCVVSIILKNHSINKGDYKFLLLGFTCLLVYMFSKSALLTTLVAILADFIIGVPTIFKAFNNPELERSNAWLLGMISWAFALINCLNKEILFFFLPFYMLLFNGYILYLTTGKNSDIKQKFIK